ncbi:chemotaxis protein CheW [Niveispirillum sp. KHB5.9]|uniref:chemotaxis protein CheW n=1 Tax=Niveispirillum sp. KHB5.9 TaxID=3400269 RepID=UPI003A8C4B02
MPPAVAATRMIPGNGDALLLSFAIGALRLSLPLARVLEVVPMPTRLSPLPLAPLGVKGLAHVRGQVAAILHAHRLLDLPETGRVAVRLLLIRHGGMLLGLPVDTVHGLTRDSDGLTALDLDGLLDRALCMPARPPLGDLRARSGKPAAAELARPRRALVSFMVAGQEYALPVAVLRCTASLPGRTVPLPHAPAPVLGMGMVGERLLPLVALRPLLGLPNPDGAAGKVLVVTHAGRHFGLVVDRLRALLHVDEADVEPVPSLFNEMGREVEAVCRLEGGKRLVSLLSPAHLLARDGVGAVLAHTGAEAAAPEATASRDRRTALLRVRVADGDYAIPLEHISAVARPGPLTPVPQAPGILAGLSNADGIALPVIDLRRRLGLPADATVARHVVMVQAEGRRFGVLVDLATGLRMLPDDAIGPAPSLSDAQARLVTRIADDGADMLPILEPSRLAEAAGVAS